MNLERRLLAILRLGNYPKRYLKMSFFCESLFLFSLENAFFISFQKQSVVAAYSVCRYVPGSDCNSAASAYLENEMHAQGDGESLLA